jgi:hypothetical protein
MLIGMDVAAARAAVEPWIALGIVLGIVGLVLTGVVALLVARRRTAPRDVPAAPAARWTDDDLPGFLANPPGAASRPAGDAVVPLAVPAPPPSAPSRPAPPSVAAVALGAAALLLVATLVVAAVAAAVPRERAGAERGAPADPGAAGHRHGGGHRPAPGGEAVAARLTFAGIVLEERAVGVTVTYPELVLDGGIASLALPTWNCLAGEAPEDPVAAGCAPGRTEYAELGPPGLAVGRDRDGLRLVGEFPTTTRPTSGADQPTGRSYRLVVTITAGDGSRPGRWTPVSGVLELGGRQAASVEGELRLGR